MTHGSAGDRLEINLTPLLDLVLQLIMFFMLTVNFVRLDQVNERVDLPVVQSAMPLKNAGDYLVYINIGKDGERLAGGTKLDTLTQLRAYLRNRKDEMERTARVRGLSGPVAVIVVVRAHKDVPCGIVLDTLQECNQLGYRNWQLRVIQQAV
jgi:biopolymer transport protein ExbD